jgi:hypothetical protein
MRELDREIKNLIDLLARTGSEAMLEGLNILESERAEINFELCRISEELAIKQISEPEIRQSFAKAREMLLSGDLPTNATH